MRRAIAGDDQSYVFEATAGMDEPWTVARIRETCKRANVQLSSGFDIDDDKQPIRPILLDMLLKIKIMDGKQITADDPALKEQVAKLLNGSHPGLHEKKKQLAKASFTYSKPAQEGRDTMTLRELLEAIVESEKVFRPLTHFGKGIDTQCRYLETMSMVR